MCIKIMYNIITFKNVFQYQMANFNAKPQLLLHQLNTSYFTGYDFLSTIIACCLSPGRAEALPAHS